MNSSIEEIKKFLKDWIDKDTPPDSFLSIQFNNSTKESIVYNLGLYLYKELTNEEYSGVLKRKEVQQPRVYQFLNIVLKKDEKEREVDPQILLLTIGSQNRDIIEESIDNGNYRVEKFSTVGLTRLQNQDYLGTLELDNALVLIVADGVGGAESGEIASKIAVNFMRDSFKNSFSSHMESRAVQDFLEDIVFQANQEVVEYSKKHNIDMMGTTLSVAVIVDRINLYIAHVGDTRIYELEHHSKVRQRTPDHSVREILFRSNKITQEEREEYKKNILAYCLGKSNLKRENIFVEYSILYEDSQLFLCSDGFWEKIVVKKNTFELSLEELKERIYATIPTDNVTIIRYLPKVYKSQAISVPYEEDYSEEEEKISSSNKKQFSNRKINPDKIRAKKINRIKRVVMLVTVIVIIAVVIIKFSL
ncbi:Protein serine/threonine phosphatase PrpC, regulation of stationary phase [hydrothermal vent metagenome]|uniref:Protein serine/threonine phosphatase PrpC, regulation of stationary phase n=1 Tax=hydrothermal vent metagenome TaxID=652676 RepID=A0A1W1CK47_9ZZZZ